MKPVIWGKQWPHCHILMFSDEIKIDMRFACPKDVKKMLVQKARSVNWKKRAAKHEYEELKEGAWLEPGLALLRKKMKANWTEKHRNVARNIFLEGVWTQKRLFDIGGSDVSQCQACQVEEGTEKHRLYHCPEWYKVRREISEASSKREQKARTSKKEWKWQRGIVTHPLGDGQWNRRHFCMKKWESEEHKNWGVPAEVFKGHVATDGSLLGTTGKWGACGLVSGAIGLDYDEELAPLHVMYGSMKTDFEVQRTSKTAELTAFLCLLKKVIGLIKTIKESKMVHGEDKENALIRKLVMLICGS